MDKQMIIDYSRLDFEGHPYSSFTKTFTGATPEEVIDQVVAYEKANLDLREDWRRWFPYV